MKNLSITTGQQIQVVKIENLKEVENLKNFYTKSSEEDIQQLVNSIKNEGQKCKDFIHINKKNST